MDGSKALERIAAAAVSACTTLLAACGGNDGSDTLEGRFVTDRADALRIVAAAIVAPLDCSEMAHALLASAVERHQRSHERPAAAGDRWLVADARESGSALIEIDAVERAEGLLLRGEAGHLRATLRLERFAIDGAATLDGTIALDVARALAGDGATHRSTADALTLSDGSRSARWSYFDIGVGPQRSVQRLNVVSALSLDSAGEVWLDVTSDAKAAADDAANGPMLSSRRYVASGVLAFMDARLDLDVDRDGGWSIAVDNERDGGADFTVRAAPAEARSFSGFARCALPR